MPPFRYQKLRDHFLKVLQPHFVKAAVPPEAPGKIDYGDIDVLVEQASSHLGLSIPKIASLLQAKRHTSNGGSMSFAVKLPSELEDTSVPFAQLDVSTCQQGYLEWGVFMNSYGDLWQIIGLTIRDLGLTATDRGLHVRIPEIDAHNAKESRLFMTHDPVLTMQFMGLDEKRFAAGFDSENEMFAWIADGRLFSCNNLEQRQNSNDRQRLRKRPQFKRFLDEWVPNNRHLWTQKRVPSRSQILEEALNEFNLESVYTERLQCWQEATAEKDIMSKIAAIITLDNSEKLNLAMRALKRWAILSPGVGLSVRSEPAMAPQYQCSFSTATAEMGETNILQWIHIHWEDIVEHEKQRVKAAKKERDAAKCN
ncbi:MAG: hypothetical protein Q9165_003264 [Trypethelium subeluteriae]